MQSLLELWFSASARQHWFKVSEDFDAYLREHWGNLPDEAAAGVHDAWQTSPEGALALCIALDQLPRNIHRGTPRAFAYDERARRVADRALARRHDQALAAERRTFMYLPFEHSEDLADQDRSVELFRSLSDTSQLWYAERHREIIARFGRFPHRNAVLGRTSTEEELAFLREPGSSF